MSPNTPTPGAFRKGLGKTNKSLAAALRAKVGPEPPEHVTVSPDGSGESTVVATANMGPQVPEPRQVPPWLKNAGIGSWSIIGVVIVVGAIVFATAKISAVFIAVFVALVFTSVLNPVVNMLNKHLNRGLSVLLAILGGVLIFAGMLTFVIGSVAGQWSSLLRQLSHGMDKISDFLDKLPFNVNVSSDQIYDWFTGMVQKGQHYVTQNWQALVSKVMSNAGGIAIFFTIVGLAIFVTVFFLLQGSQMWRWFLNMLPTDKRAITNHAAQAGWHSFAGYARGTMIIAFIDGMLAWIFLEILRVPLAPALGVLVMIGALIPLIGAPAAMVVAMIVALATDGVLTALIVGIGIALIGQLEGHVLQPLIMGRQVSLHPVVVGIGVIAGTLLAGLLGAIIAIPIIGVAWAVFNALYHRDPPIVGPLPDTIGETAPKRPRGKISRFFHKLFRRHSKDGESSTEESAADAAAIGEAEGQDATKVTVVGPEESAEHSTTESRAPGPGDSGPRGTASNEVAANKTLLSKPASGDSKPKADDGVAASGEADGDSGGGNSKGDVG